MSDADRWSEYWLNEGTAGEVFVDADGRQNPALGDFWKPVFAANVSADTIIDIACGGGSVFAHADDRKPSLLVGADLSADAIRNFNERFPHACGIVASADRLPFADRSVDLCVSQFGVEYAGVDAFGEVARILRAEGQFVALVHIRDGYIDARNAAELEGAELCEQTDFISHAIAVTGAIYRGGKADFESAADAFAPAERALAEMHDAHPRGVHAHLYAGFRQLFERRSQYAEQDISGWLEAMRDDVRKSVERLTAMRSAALSRSDIDGVHTLLESRGLVVEAPEEFQTTQDLPPVAWVLRAARPT